MYVLKVNFVSPLRNNSREPKAESDSIINDQVELKFWGQSINKKNVPQVPSALGEKWEKLVENNVAFN